MTSPLEFGKPLRKTVREELQRRRDYPRKFFAPWARVTTTAVVYKDYQGYFPILSSKIGDLFTIGLDPLSVGDPHGSIFNLSNTGNKRGACGVTYDSSGNPVVVTVPDNFDEVISNHPVPGLTSVEIDFSQNVERAKFSFEFYNHHQLELFDRYVFRPGLSIIIEIGQNSTDNDPKTFQLKRDSVSPMKFTSTNIDLLKEYQKNQIPKQKLIDKFIMPQNHNTELFVGKITTFSVKREASSWVAEVDAIGMSELSFYLSTGETSTTPDEDETYSIFDYFKVGPTQGSSPAKVHVLRDYEQHKNEHIVYITSPVDEDTQYTSEGTEAQSLDTTDPTSKLYVSFWYFKNVICNERISQYAKSLPATEYNLSFIRELVDTDPTLASYDSELRTVDPDIMVINRDKTSVTALVKDKRRRNIAGQLGLTYVAEEEEESIHFNIGEFEHVTNSVNPPVFVPSNFKTGYANIDGCCFLNFRMIEEAFSNAKSFVDAFRIILNQINAATAHHWDLKYVIDTDGVASSGARPLKVYDANQLVPEDHINDPDHYIFNASYDQSELVRVSMDYHIPHEISTMIGASLYVSGKDSPSEYSFNSKEINNAVGGTKVVDSFDNYNRTTQQSSIPAPKVNQSPAKKYLPSVTNSGANGSYTNNKAVIDEVVRVATLKGVPEAGICALLSTIQAESGFNPYALNVTPPHGNSKGEVSVGLFQYNFTGGQGSELAKGTPFERWTASDMATIYTNVPTNRGKGQWNVSSYNDLSKFNTTGAADGFQKFLENKGVFDIEFMVNRVIDDSGTALYSTDVLESSRLFTAFIKPHGYGNGTPTTTYRQRTALEWQQVLLANNVISGATITPPAPGEQALFDVGAYNPANAVEDMMKKYLVLSGLVEYFPSVMKDVLFRRASTHTNVPFPTKVSLTLNGIASVRFGDGFKVRRLLPRSFDNGIIWNTDIKHSVTNEGWYTTIGGVYIGTQSFYKR